MTEDERRRRFAEVVLPHLDDALSLARWLTGSAVDAEDVAQDACIRAFGALETLRDGGAKPWLLAIVRNTAFTWLAKNRPKMLLITGDDRVFEQPGVEADARCDTETPEAALIAKADAGLLHRAIGELPLPYREVLVLREIEGLSYREIGRITEVPVGTVMSRLSRARAILIARIGPASTARKSAS